MQKFNNSMENMIIKIDRKYSKAMYQFNERLGSNMNKDSMTHYSVEPTVY